MASSAKVVFDVHRKAMRSREARTLLSNCMAFFNERMRGYHTGAGYTPLRDPVTDFANGIGLWMLLEALEGKPLGVYNEAAVSDRGKMENLYGALAVMAELGIKPVGDGLWDARGLMEENALHAWSVMTALAVHYDCDRDLEAGAFLPIIEKHYTNADDALPYAEKTRRFVLIPEDWSPPALL
ncbi:uncharacterized protein AMSG_01835 [Thecamonas trahens ATCC 50062]|uniref:Uncharacterized protein n=1 Tax=Thecamonas trahens ATCC 50062 TaxID=461836 RepID=A0A0L0DU62_THETB|nr:hypothetical protein AMSG_01835 [Thecamonas trahens ATCC 50062]KNC55571.1 hypothetical protein AMSG_01835 [Thecamonas trahens ATCC 50062]|eukprot:XP_013761345.1 hypothetical protein AMSG_01835 [Thecamonas trahens ATCC 50062]